MLYYLFKNVDIKFYTKNIYIILFLNLYHKFYSFMCKIFL